MAENEFCKECHFKTICKHSEKVEEFINAINDEKRKLFGTKGSILYCEIKCDYKKKSESILRRKDSI